jgi:DNA-binding response OmpR family regulator
MLDGYARGAADFLVRPFEPEILRCKVAVFVDLYLKEQTIRQQAARLRAQDRGIPQRDDTENVCMVKPLDLGRLIEYVASAVGRSGEQSKK